MPACLHTQVFTVFVKSLPTPLKRAWSVLHCCPYSSCLVARSCPTVLQPHRLVHPPGSSVHGILQARILDWVAISFSRGSSWPRDWTRTSCMGRRIRSHQGRPCVMFCWSPVCSALHHSSVNCLSGSTFHPLLLRQTFSNLQSRPKFASFISWSLAPCWSCIST